MRSSIHITQAVEIEADATAVWEAFQSTPHDWWGHPYSLLDGEGTIEFPAEAGAAVIERLGEATALWGVVSQCTPGSVYGWIGQMGMGAASHGEVVYSFEASGTGTLVTVQHDFALAWGDADAMRESYDFGWADLSERLKRYVESGERYGFAGRNETPSFKFTPSAAG
ncbi:SRPBCC family protein [Agrococcus casei]|uniref:SRPBCC family protein n=1 Tax=Agrococcus casei TaxID=343512 RepID=UPI003F9211DC